MKYAKKMLALLLAMLLAVLSASVAFAAVPEDSCPVVYVHGFMSSEILADPNDPDSEVVWGPDVGAILGDVKNGLPALLTALLTKNWEKFGDKVLEIVNPYFRPAFYDNNGEPVNGTGVWFSYPRFVSKYSEVVFRYDWREDPMKTAVDLHDFIEYVCREAGVSQVKVQSHSYGGVVFAAYLTLYGNDRVRSAVFDSTAIFGEAYTGDLMTGHIVFEPQTLENYLKYALAGTDYDTMLQDLLKTARVMGLTDLLIDLADELLEAQGERIERELLLPMFANWPSIWAMIPDQDVDAAKQFVFEELGKDTDRSGLREKVEAYNTQVRPYKADTLKALNEKANLYVLSRTGYSSIPLTPSACNLSDGTVDTMYSSFGATTADFGKQLPADVIAAADPAYISPEKDIDASTCMFPDQTWFIRGAKHAPVYDEMEDLIYMLLDSPVQVTVKSFAEYPQFMAINPGNGDMQADQTGSAAAQSGVAKARGILEHVRAFLLELRRLFELVLSKLKLK